MEMKVEPVLAASPVAVRGEEVFDSPKSQKIHFRSSNSNMTAHTTLDATLDISTGLRVWCVHGSVSQLLPCLEEYLSANAAETWVPF